jgi:hypothetical protein
MISTARKQHSDDFRRQVVDLYESTEGATLSGITSDWAWLGARSRPRSLPASGLLSRPRSAWLQRRCAIAIWSRRRPAARYGRAVLQRSEAPERSASAPAEPATALAESAELPVDAAAAVRPQRRAHREAQPRSVRQAPKGIVQRARSATSCATAPPRRPATIVESQGRMPA